MRRNIFDIIKAKQNPVLELERIDELLNKDGGVYVTDELFKDLLDKGTPTSIVKYIDNHLFKSWKQRETCIDCEDLRCTLGIEKIPKTENELTVDFIFIYCEYASNLIYLLKQKLGENDEVSNIVSAADENIRKFLGWYNCELKYFPKQEKVLVVHKNPAATAVAEIIDESLAYSVIDYNHHLLKGDIAKKKAILLALGSDLEPKRAEIKSLDKDLEDSIFFMLNNLDLRHNNRKKGDKNYKEKVAKMSKAKLEGWYDELYQLILTAYILLDNRNRIPKIAQLKQDIK